MKKCFWLVVMIFCAMALACSACSDPSQDTDAGADAGNTDSDTGPDTEMPPDYSWEEEQILSIKNPEHYQWAINDQVNVIVAFVAGDEADHLLSTATLLMENKLPWLWLAKVDMSDAPDVFEAAGVETALTLKFFSYGVEMDELTLTGEATDMQMTDNAQALIDRYEPDVLTATTAEELETMLTDPATPILVKFGAPWCGWCNLMAPRLELASVEYGDELLDADGNFVYDQKRLTIIDVNTDEVPGMWDEYGFTGIPYSIFYNKGVQYNDLHGFRPYQVLKAEIDTFLSSCSTEKGYTAATWSVAGPTCSLNGNCDFPTESSK